MLVGHINRRISDCFRHLEKSQAPSTLTAAIQMVKHKKCSVLRCLMEWKFCALYSGLYSSEVFSRAGTTMRLSWLVVWDKTLQLGHDTSHIHKIPQNSM